MKYIYNICERIYVAIISIRCSIYILAVLADFLSFFANLTTFRVSCPEISKGKNVPNWEKMFRIWTKMYVVE